MAVRPDRCIFALQRFLTRLRGFAVFQGVRSLFINKLDEKVFTTAGGCYFASGTDYAPLVGHFAVVGTLGVRS
jgi:hypothetical protein